MQNPEELAQKAIISLELAQKFEEEKNTPQAILNYEKAVDFLKQSGYLMHRINDIYERIEELKKSLKKEKIYQQTQIKTQVQQLQDQAFALLEGAKKMVEAAKKTGKLLQIGHQRRSNPRYIHCHDKLIKEANLLGRITTINGQWNRSRAACEDLAPPGERGGGNAVADALADGH